VSVYVPAPLVVVLVAVGPSCVRTVAPAIGRPVAKSVTVPVMIVVTVHVRLAGSESGH